MYIRHTLIQCFWLTTLLQCRSLNIMFDQHFNNPHAVDCDFEDPSMNCASP